MRIDALNSSYTIDRSAREPGSKALSFRDIQRDQEIRREQPQPSSATQGMAAQPQLRQVEASQPVSQVYDEPVSLQRFAVNPVSQGLSTRAQQALAAYGATANMAVNFDAYEVVGIDLYA